MAAMPSGATFGLVQDFEYGPAFEQLVTLSDFTGDRSESYGIGGLYVERVRSVAFEVQAVGGVTQRFALVELQDQGGVTFAAAQSPYYADAGHTSRFVFAVGIQQAGFTNAPVILAPLPEAFLQPTYSVKISLVVGVVADLVTQVRILTEKFSTSPRDFPPGQGPENGG